MPLPTIDERILDEAQVMKLRKLRANIATADQRITLAKEELKAARGERFDVEEKLFAMVDNLNQPELKFTDKAGTTTTITEGDAVKNARRERQKAGDATSPETLKEKAARHKSKKK